MPKTQLLCYRLVHEMLGQIISSSGETQINTTGQMTGIQIAEKVKRSSLCKFDTKRLLQYLKMEMQMEIGYNHL